MYPVVLLWAARVGWHAARGSPLWTRTKVTAVAYPHDTPAIFILYLVRLHLVFLSLLININFSITTYKNLSCNYMNCFYFILIFNRHVRSSSRPDLFGLFPPGGDDRRGLCGDTNPGSTPKGGGCICVCVLVQYMKASHLLRQGCKLAPHLLPQLDQITFTLHPLSSPCVVPRSLYLSSIHPLLTHYLTLSWD